MPKLEITLTDTQYLALTKDIIDPQFMFQSQAQGRAMNAIEDIVKLEVARALNAGENVPSDKSLIVKQAFDKGTVKSAQQMADEAQAEQSTGVTVPDTIEPTPELVDQEVVKRKMALVGASDASQLNEIILEGTRQAVKLLQVRLDSAWTGEQAARAAELNQREVVLEELENVGELIKADIASGAVTKTDAIASDPRWQEFGA